MPNFRLKPHPSTIQNWQPITHIAFTDSLPERADRLIGFHILGAEIDQVHHPY
jgi:hypothetical protein